LLDKVKEKWDIAGAVIFDINETDHIQAGKIILSTISHIPPYQQV